jgi:hypothetical protein
LPEWMRLVRGSGGGHALAALLAAGQTKTVRLRHPGETNGLFCGRVDRPCRGPNYPRICSVTSARGTGNLEPGNHTGTRRESRGAGKGAVGRKDGWMFRCDRLPGPGACAIAASSVTLTGVPDGTVVI